MLTKNFFDRDAQQVARELLGKVIYVKQQSLWLCAQIIETEAYYLEDKASHASLGYTEKRKALFMPAGTVYMYYARGGDSLNVSCQGDGNAVLIKAAIPYRKADALVLQQMQCNNPKADGSMRDLKRLCSGQTLLCKALSLKVPEWDAKAFDPERFFMADVGYVPESIIQAPRLGIRIDRDAHLLYRFVDREYAAFSTTPRSLRSFRK